MSVYQEIEPTGTEVPIVLSVPHCGTLFPAEIENDFKPDMRTAPDDTDWFVDTLYNFSSELGITLLHACHSRWVIDLNRDPQSKPLYTDGRIITALCPTTNFIGESIYIDERQHVEQPEVNRRIQNYYLPYHHKLTELLEEKRKKFGRVLLWDCHSIRQFVPTIYSQKFPDLILGDADETSASKNLIDITLRALNESSFSVAHNHPFKGGYITRQYGKPKQHVHALQLEMSKVLYMDDREQRYHKQRAEVVRQLLMNVFKKICSAWV